MTEKVKIPQDIADAIERLRNADYSDYGIVLHVGSEGPSAINGVPTERRILGNWTYDNGGENADKLLDALRIGYEIEPEYKVGDWVAFEKNRSTLIVCAIEQVSEMSVDTDYVGGNGYKQNFGKENIRHATTEEIKTEKERRKWAEIEPGDVLRIKDEPQAIGMFKGEGAEGTVLVETLFGAVIWLKPEIELYAKKVGDAK